MKVILKERFRVHANDGNYNNHIGMPMSILSAPPDTEILIMEMGMNHVGEIKALSNCLHPNIGVITNVGTSHIGNLGSRESIAHAKLEILSGMNHGRLFIPSNEPLLEGYHNATQVSETDLEPIYKIGNIKEDHNRKNLAFTVSIAEFVGMTHDEIQVGISRISTENIRQRLVLRENYHFLVDCYNSSYESVKALIDSAKMRPEYPHRALVLGDILELGEHSEEIHYRVGKLVKPLDFDHLFLFGSSSDFILRGALENSFERGKIFINYNLTSPNITAGQIKSNCAEDELILMKASRGVRLERILDYF
jgi:UDP-N-acetylmuramoyl-tripeptide--D-alanyl-D-alanine ligase